TYPPIVCTSCFFFLLLPRPPRPTLFPYTTLFRSVDGVAAAAADADDFDAGSGGSLFVETQSQALGLFRLFVHRQHSLKRAMNEEDRKSTRLNSSHRTISYAVFCLKKKKIKKNKSL